MTVKVIIDTNFFMIPPKYHIDIFSELGRLVGAKVECIITPAVKSELEALLQKGSKTSQQASIAIELAKRCTVLQAVAEDRNVDDEIVMWAKRLKAVVATLDIELRKELRVTRTPVIYMRGRSKLEIDGLDPEYLLQEATS